MIGNNTEGLSGVVGVSQSSSFATPEWNIDPQTISVRFLRPPTAPSDTKTIKELLVLKEGTPVSVDEAAAKALLDLEDIVIDIDLQGGSFGRNSNKAVAEATYWTCDFSKEYIAVRMRI